MLACEAQGADLAVDATNAEAARNHDAVDIVEGRSRTGLRLAQISGDPFHVDLGPVGETACLDGLGDRKIGIGKVDVLADDGDVDLMLGVVHAFKKVLPLVPINVVERQAELSDHIGVETFVEQHLRHIVDAVGVHTVHHALGVDVAHERDLVFDGLVERTVAAQYECIRRDAELSQHHHGMLRRLRLELMGGGDVGHKRYMDEHAVPGTEITTHLTCGLHERLRFDVTHCAADLGDDHVDVIGGLRTHTGFDLVRDMRDHLHALAEVLTSAFLAKDLLIDLAGGDVRLL